jgi:AmmeMemoRadiSam system protein A
MNDTDRKALLSLASLSVEAAANGDVPPQIPDDEVFSKQGGAFVTLKLNGRLRGCIGHFTGLGSLGETVRVMAREAAISDPRFAEVSPGEAKRLVIEISVLSPMQRIDPEDVIPGIHGLYIRKGTRAGTLLPQVAVEEGWDRKTFLAHTCLKAGLHSEAYTEKGTEILAYTAEVFREESNEKRS